MLKKKIVSLFLGVVLFSTACGADSELVALTNVQALNSEATVTSNYKLSWSDEEDLVYAQVSSRQLLDLSLLDACTDNELQQVISFMNQIDSQLVGNLRTATYSSLVEKYVTSGLVEDESVVDTYLTDYLLTFFARTPYYWQRTKTTVRGVDPSSRSIIVDVQYSTIDFEKEVMTDSFITRGEPDYETLVQNRYMRWIHILSTRMYDPFSDTLQQEEEDFKLYYGDPEEIIASQRILSPTSDIYMTGNQSTVTGLIDSVYEKSGATCSVRYILVPEYVMGINLGLSCQNMYLTSFKLDEDPTEGMTSFTQEGYATVTDSVYSLVYNYFTCIDESNYSGLYKLTTDFSKLDKYYEDLFNSTYQKHNGFSVSLFDIKGTHITCGVTISSKERAKNSNMTFPSYTDRYLMELELVDDTLKVSNLVHVSRVLEGEPSIVSGDADVSGFTAAITLDNDDKMAIEDLICNFSALQLLGDVTSDKFSGVVDISVTTNQLATLQEATLSLTGNQKSVFLQNYMQGTSNYASVKCREQFKDEDGVVEADATYEFIQKGGRWYIYNYTVNGSMRLDSGKLATSGALCLVSPGKVEAYTSQVKGTMSNNIEDASDTSVSFDHASYVPVLKAEESETIEKFTGVDITQAEFDMMARAAGMSIDYEMYGECRTYVEPLGFDFTTFDMGFLDLMAVAYNQMNRKYVTGELDEGLVTGSMDMLRAQLDTYIAEMDSSDEELVKYMNNLSSSFDGLSDMIKGQFGR